MDLKDTSHLEERAAALLDAAKAAGADAADAVAVRGVSLGVEVREGVLEESERSEGDSLSLRVFIGKKQAVVSTNETATEGFAELAARAVAIARAAPEDPYAGLAEPTLLASAASRSGGEQTLDILDDHVPDADDLQKRALAAEARALAANGVSKSGGASASWGLGGMVLVTSDGFSGAYLRSSHSTAMTAIAGEGTRMERDYAGHSTTHFSDLESPEEIGEKAAERAVKRVNPRKMETTTAPVVFDRRAASTVLGHLTSAINGAGIARGSSFLKDKLGTRIFAKGIEITDDPLRPRGSASRPFDGEGVAATPLSLIDDGVLTTWLLDSASARQLDLKSNGRAGRSSGSAPSPSSTNVTLHPGSQSPEEIMKALGTGLLVTGFIGRGVNLVTGDYSRGVAGFWFENGEIAYPVSEITIAGHLGDMFAALTPANDLEFRGAVNAPTIHVGEMTIAGQ